jgi:hypothetical protein
VPLPPSDQIRHLQCFTTRHRRCGPSDTDRPPLPRLLSTCRPSPRALLKSRRLPRSAAYTSSVRTPRSFPMSYPLSSCTTTPRSVIEHRLGVVLHRRGAGAASPSWLCSARRAHDVRRERCNLAWSWLTSRFGPVWQWAMHCCSRPRPALC